MMNIAFAQNFLGKYNSSNSQKKLSSDQPSFIGEHGKNIEMQDFDSFNAYLAKEQSNHNLSASSVALENDEVISDDEKLVEEIMNYIFNIIEKEKLDESEYSLKIQLEDLEIEEHLIEKGFRRIEIDNYLTNLNEELENETNSEDKLRILIGMLQPLDEQRDLEQETNDNQIDISNGLLQKKHIDFRVINEIKVNQASKSADTSELLEAYKDLQNILITYEENPTHKNLRNILNELNYLYEQTKTPQAQQVILNKLNEEPKDTNSVRTDEILTKFLKKAEANRTGVYHIQKTVTTKDVGKWLEQVTQAMDGKELVSRPEFLIGQTRLATFEQYILPTNVEAIDSNEDFTSRLSTIVDRSQFMKFGLGKQNQLTIHLRPENLGEITLRMIQVNGETIVKLIVHSEQAKRLLDANMSQLKPMFSPHQVSVETRADLQGIQESDMEKMQDQDNQEEDESEQQQKENKGTQSFEELFNDYIDEL